MRKTIPVLILSLLLSLIVAYMESQETLLKEEEYLLREEVGAKDYEAELILEIQGKEESADYTVAVPAMRMTNEEEQRLLEAAVVELEETFLGENASLEKVQNQVVMRESYQEGLVTAEWSFQSAKRIKSNGKIEEEGLIDAGESVVAKVSLVCEDSSLEHSFGFVVYPQEKSEEELLYQGILDRIHLEGQKEGEDRLMLPTEVNGYELHWKDKKSQTPLQVFFIGCIVALLLPLMEKQKKEEREKLRKEQLLREYPEMINKLVILLGAGMTLQSAWNKITRILLYSS